MMLFHQSESERERGQCCICGHYKSEHSDRSCSGAYATLMADADDFESVEVGCHCPGWFAADLPFEVRT